MKLSILLAGSILTSAIVGNVYAQTCGAQPSCSSLGYNLSSTSGCLGTAVKCPFENKYNCITQSNLSEYSKNSSNWWYKDKGTGLIFQGGKVNVTTNSDMTVYFNKSFSSVPATVILTPYEQPTNHSNDTNYVAMAVGISTSSFNNSSFSVTSILFSSMTLILLFNNPDSEKIRHQSSHFYNDSEFLHSLLHKH